MLDRRKALGLLQLQQASQQAQANLLQLEEFARANCIALYAPLHQELETALLFESARQAGKKVLYPAVCGTELQFRQVQDPAELIFGTFGISEPCRSCPDHGIADLDLMVIPGVAFDLRGHRIGFGKGYYDRCLAEGRGKTLLVGFCHDFQLVEEVPAEGHDIRMDLLVTESRVIRVVTGP